jgi:hypothetical protein
VPCVTGNGIVLERFELVLIGQIRPSNQRLETPEPKANCGCPVGHPSGLYKAMARASTGETAVPCVQDGIRGAPAFILSNAISQDHLDLQATR